MGFKPWGYVNIPLYSYLEIIKQQMLVRDGTKLWHSFYVQITFSAKSACARGEKGIRNLRKHSMGVILQWFELLGTTGRFLVTRCDPLIDWLFGEERNSVGWVTCLSLYVLVVQTWLLPGSEDLKKIHKTPSSVKSLQIKPLLHCKSICYSIICYVYL